MSYFVLGSTCSMHEHPSEGLGQEAGDISRSGPNDMASRLEDALLSTLHRCSEPSVLLLKIRTVALRTK